MASEVVWAQPRTMEAVKPLVEAEASLWVCSPPGDVDVAAAETRRLVMDAVASFVASDRCTAAGSIRLVRWDVGPSSPQDVQAVAHTLGVRPPITFLAIGRGELLDKVVGAEQVHDTVVGGTFLEKFNAYVDGRPVAAGPGASVEEQQAEQLQEGLRENSASVDVAKLVTQGKGLMGKGQAFYAAKFFAKALALLDCFEEEQRSGDDNINGSTAVCLAWLIMALVVQGATADAAPHVARLESEQFATFRVEESEPSRAVALGAMVAAASWTWSAAECSQKALAAALAIDPKAAALREKLVVTLFLAGDIERCLTEALKLHVTGSGFGAAAIEAAIVYLGATNPLVTRLGWDQLKALPTAPKA